MSASAQEQFAQGLLQRLPRDPLIYAQNLDLLRERVLLVQLDSQALRAASFLDDRLLGPGTPGAWFSLTPILAAPIDAAAQRPLHFIFHTSHVGSTLLSRLLDECAGLQSLREPLPLRVLADAYDVLQLPESLLSPAQYDALLLRFIALWRRGVSSTRAVVLKATSTVGRLAAPLLNHSGTARAVYLNLDAEPWLATLLAGENSALDLRALAAGRLRRLQARGLQALRPLHSLQVGELAALSWLAETWCQQDAREQFPDRCLALDFGEFLGAVADHMARVLGHFDLPCDAPLLERLVRSPVLTRYSKAPEHAYSPALRNEVLQDSRRRHAAQISLGLSWIEELARRESSVADLLARGSR